MKFQEVPSRYDGPRLEQAILEFWDAHQVFAKSLAASEGRPLFTFNEGPPTANGRPGIHHVLARTFKDIFPRYKTMRGFHAPRRAGWDTHGLPVEHEIEKELGIFDKTRIEQEVGIEEFTRRCRESVMRYIGDWERMTERMGFWVDLENAYYTLNNAYIESVWYLLKTIWDKGLIYQDYKVVPYDPRIGATLSSHEVALGYQEVEDPSVYVRFPLADDPQTALLVWTTTPWTLPANLAAAVHPEVTYAYVALEGERPEKLILAAELIPAALGDTPHRVVKQVPGTELVGLRYRRPFDYLAAEGDCWRVLPADFVSTEDGTGIVHIAPAYGADDLALAKEHGLPVVHGVGLDGLFLPDVTPVAGMFFKQADPTLTEELRECGLLFRAGTVLHNYPFGWRTGDPLIYYAKNAWYIRTTDVKDAMIAHNRTIHWIPESIRDGRFGNWLENNVDWALSRERFWGTPLPLWTDGEGDYLMVGSLAELEKLAGRPLQDLDLHRPAVDGVTFPHPETGKPLHRVPEVIDCWFDSGAMSYAQWHYPFENAERFERHFPADYICEAIDQTRGWFYTLHAIAVLVSDSVAYRNVICLSHIVDADGKKMSKSQGNIVDPYDVFDHIGADPLRWYFLARLAPDQQKRISEGIVADVAGSFLNTLWNTYAFFVLYANLDGFEPGTDVPVAERPEIDRWALALLHRTVATVTESLERYHPKAAGEAIEDFVDQLSNWYVRRNRRRFWKSEAGPDKQAAYLTLYECLTTTARLIAPFMPFLGEELFQNLVRGAAAEAPLSVHMDTWPEADPESFEGESLISDIKVVQKIVGLGRNARTKAGIRTRQPLAAALVVLPDDVAHHRVERFFDELTDELNVEQIVLIGLDDGRLTHRMRPNLPSVGRKYGRLIPKIRDWFNNASRGETIEMVRRLRRGIFIEKDINGTTVVLEPDDVLIDAQFKQGFVSSEDGGYAVALNTELDDELRRKGLQREILRSAQEARKQAGLKVHNRIRLRITGTPRVMELIEDADTKSEMGEQLLTAKWESTPFQTDYVTNETLDGEQWRVEIAVAEGEEWLRA